MGGLVINVIAYYVVTKENLCREIVDKTAELFLGGMSYEEALKKLSNCIIIKMQEENLNKTN